MKKKIMYIITTVIILGFQACSKEMPETTKGQDNVTDKEKSLVLEANSFALDFFKTFPEQNSDSNFFISPLSISLALSMTYNGAEGETKTAFENALRFNGFTREEINVFNKKIVDILLNADEKVDLNIANSIWNRNTFSVLDSFINTNKTYYNAEVFSADFNNPETVNDINKWCSDKTKGKIPQVLDEIPSAAVMYLINAIYFKATWFYEFDESKTTDTIFNKSNGEQISHKQMQQQSVFNYMENDFMQLIELPYGNGNFSMMVLLPSDGYNTADIVNNLNDTNWNQWVSEMDSQEVVVKLPKFKFEWGRTINDEVIAMGLGNAFSDAADFSGINPEIPLQISRVIHKSFVDVNEKGTEAAAVTVVEIIETSMPDGPVKNIKYFTANKPFVFIIREKTSGVLLFMGKVENPEYN
jgi:serine protease inhibitor